MRKAAVIGSPVSHTKSPAIFAFLAKELGVKDFQYNAREVAPVGLKSFLEETKSQKDWVGLNVTIPHKEKILSLLDEVSDDARAIGAVNAVTIQEGSARGFNTDVIGIRSTLVENGSFSELKGKNALILGSGGAARAVAHVLGSIGVREILICNQNRPRAEELARDFSGKFPNTQFRGIDRLERAQGIVLSLIANTTPLGMLGVTQAANGQSALDFFSELSFLTKSEGALAFDLIYNPQDTAFMVSARSHGFRSVGGLPMLVDQALAAWEIWAPETRNGKTNEASTSSIRAQLLTYLRELFNQETRERPIFLTGFMGVGKTVVAAALARKLGRTVIDTDKQVEQETGLSIPQIFSEKGEQYFRDIEKKVVAQAASEPNRVVALGGGALVDPDSLLVVKKKGCLIFLDADVEALEKRLHRTAESRPLLARMSAEERSEKIKTLLAERMPIYQQAEIKIKTDDCRAEDVADQIANLLSKIEEVKS